MGTTGDSAAGTTAGRTSCSWMARSVSSTTRSTIRPTAAWGTRPTETTSGFRIDGSLIVRSNMRAHTTILSVLAALLLAPVPAESAEPAAPRPNVLFLFADDQRADTIAALGNGVIQTPNLDRLVRRGVAFDQAHMQGGLQGATCVPSRAMLLSGRCLFRVDESLKRDETWPAAFGRSGYTTFISGKWHNGPGSIPASF